MAIPVGTAVKGIGKTAQAVKSGGIGKLAKDFLGYSTKKSTLMKNGVKGAGLLAGLWTGISTLMKGAGFIMDMMQFSAIMNTQEMVQDLADQVESLKFKSPQFNDQIEATREYLGREREALARSVNETSHQLKVLSNTETNIKVIDGKPIDSIMYGFGANIDETMWNKYQLPGRDTQLMNSPNVGFNELAKATLESKQDVINEVRRARNDSVKGLNRNAKMISSAGKLAGTGLKLNQEKFGKVDKKLDLIAEMIAKQSQASLAGTGMVTDLVDSTREEPKEKSLAEKLGEMYAKITTIPERLGLFGAKTALAVLGSAAAIKMIADLISGDEGPAGLDEMRANLAMDEYDLRAQGKSEEEISQILNYRREDLRRAQANTVEGYNGGVYNYISPNEGTMYEARNKDGSSAGKVFLDNQTLNQINDFYNTDPTRFADGRNGGYSGGITQLSKVICILFGLFSPKSFVAAVQACMTINILPKNMKNLIDTESGSDDYDKLQKILKKNTKDFSDRVFVPTVNFAAMTLVNIMCYTDKFGEGNLVLFSKKSNRYYKTSFIKDAVTKDNEQGAKESLFKLLIDILMGNANSKYYGKIDLYKEAASIASSKGSNFSSIGDGVKAIVEELYKFGTYAVSNALYVKGGKLAIATGIGMEAHREFRVKDKQESDSPMTAEFAKMVALSVAKNPLIGATVGTIDYLINVGIDLYKSTAQLDYYNGIIGIMQLGDDMKEPKFKFNPFDYYLTSNAAGAVLSRTLMFYKNACRSYMKSYNAAYRAKGEELEKQGKVEEKNGFYYMKGTDKLMDFSTNVEDDRKLVEYDIANSGSFLNNFRNKEFGNIQNAELTFKSKGVTEVTEPYQVLFNAGQDLRMNSVGQFDYLGNRNGMAVYADDYIEAKNMDAGPDGILTKSLFNGMNKFVKDNKVGRGYDENIDLVKVHYTSGARDVNLHNPEDDPNGWNSHHKYGLAVDVGKFDDALSKVGALNNSNETNLVQMRKMVDYINKELKANGADYYKVVLEPNYNNRNRYHLHIINGKPFIEGKLPKFESPLMAKRFKEHILNVNPGYNWTRFNGIKGVYYDMSNTKISQNVLDKLKNADPKEYASASDIGDSNEAITGVGNKIDDLAKLVLATSMKVDTSTELVTGIYSVLGSTDSKLNGIARSIAGPTPPGSELMNTDSRSI